MNGENFDTPKTMGANSKRNSEFEKVLKEYKKVIQELKLRCIEKYGKEAVDWFGI